MLVAVADMTVLRMVAGFHYGRVLPALRRAGAHEDLLQHPGVERPYRKAGRSV
jgi:hypothetical protein